MIKILVAHDDPEMRDDLKWASGGIGRDVVTVSSAKEAIEKIMQDNYHVVVPDLRMETPKAGLEVLQAAKQKNAYTQVIVVTANATPAVSVAAMGLGAADFLVSNNYGAQFLPIVQMKVNSAVGMEELERMRAERSAILGRPRASDRWPQIFVLMPFAEEMRDIYDRNISRAVSDVNLQVGRADDIFGPGSIMKDIWSAIHGARVVIADCTGRNPNVFYEIGLAHAIGRNTILISQSLDDVPFDLRHLRVIVYKYTPPGMEVFEKALMKTIREILQGESASN